MNERAHRVFPNTVVERSGYNEDFFWTRFVYVAALPTTTRCHFEHMRCGSIGADPQRTGPCGLIRSTSVEKDIMRYFSAMDAWRSSASPEQNGHYPDATAQPHRVAVPVTEPQSPFELGCAAEVFGTQRATLQNRYALEVCTEHPVAHAGTQIRRTARHQSRSLAAHPTPQCCSGPVGTYRSFGRNDRQPSRPHLGNQPAAQISRHCAYHAGRLPTRVPHLNAKSQQTTQSVRATFPGTEPDLS